jgi:hypothetical protein
MNSSAKREMKTPSTSTPEKSLRHVIIGDAPNG